MSRILRTIPRSYTRVEVEAYQLQAEEVTALALNAPRDRTEQEPLCVYLKYPEDEQAHFVAALQAHVSEESYPHVSITSERF